MHIRARAAVIRPNHEQHLPACSKKNQKNIPAEGQVVGCVADVVDASSTTMPSVLSVL